MSPYSTQKGISIPEGWEDLERQVSYCTFCPKMCRFSCPTAIVHPSEALHPTGKATLLFEFLRGRLPMTHELAEVMYRCTGCLLSRTYCDHEIQVFSPLERARAMLLKEGMLPVRARAALNSMETWGNPYGRDLSAIFHETVPSEWIEPKAQILVFAGCATLAHNPGALQDLVHLLKALRIHVVGLLPPDPLCCGGIYLDLGDEEGFRRAARSLYLKLSRAKRILTLCPHCLHTLKARYTFLEPTFGNRVEHISQFLVEQIHQIPSGTRTLSFPIIYHDPCYMGRYLGLYEAPRELLRRVLPSERFLEFPRNRQQAECCGGGGGFPLTFPEDASAIARRRWTTAPSAEVPVVTCCPLCIQLLREAHPLGKASDLVTALAQAICT